MVVELFVKNEMPVTVVCLANNKYDSIYMGLSLSYDMVTAHGGEMKMETNEGEARPFRMRMTWSDGRVSL